MYLKGIVTTILAAASVNGLVHSHDRRGSSGGNAVSDGFASGVINAQQRMDSFTRDLKSAGAHPATAALTNFITGADGQIDNLIGVVGNLASPITGGLSNVAVQAVLGPTFQSLTDGVEVLIGNVVGGTIDAALVPAMHVLSGSLSKVANVATQANMKDYSVKFVTLSHQLSSIASSKPKRSILARYADSVNAAANSVTNAQQALDSSTAQLRNAGANPPNEVVVDFLSTFGHDVDNANSVVQTSMANVGNPSKTVTSTLVNPVFQSTVNGVEVLISVLSTGSNIDAGLTEHIRSLSGSVSQMSALATKYQQDNFSGTLQRMSQKLGNIADSAIPTRNSDKIARQLDLGAGVKAGFTNAQQRIDSFTNDLKSAGPRPGAAAMTNFITGLDGQIDNVIGMTGSALAPITGGLSNVVVAAVLGPTFQSLTDGAEVLIGNLSGGAIDLVLVPAMHVFSGSLSNVANVAGNYGMNDFQKKFATQSQAISKLATQSQHGHKA